MSFPPAVAEAALVKCGRCCCICHRFCGTKIELHHIKQKVYGGEDTLENCIPLCFDCHADMGKADPMHPKGRHYTETELIMQRDSWFERVKNGYSNISTCEDDKLLFNEIRELFSQEILNILKYNDFAGLIPYSLSLKLNEIYRLSDNPEKEFINVELEKLRADLFKIVFDFKNYLAANTFRRTVCENSYLVSRVWLFKEDEIRHADEKKYAEFASEVQKMNRYAEDLYSNYRDFVRQGRRIILK